ncbi:ATP-binding cassette domain-containing protein [Desulfococcaceae bacterium HSG9]|nr:ATP-binding cassette domain-containing protein [Desulfococcaceae bacterium HSG9]
MTKLAIKVENVHKHYKALKAIDDLNFEVPVESCFGFLGPNGAGKTTMMKILYGTADRDSAENDVISVFGYDPQKNALAIKYVSGIVPQEDNLDVELSVEQNLMIYSKFYGLSKNQARPRITSVLKFMELTEKKASRIRELSGGMKRRLVIARALINNPKLLILDEPTTGLDPQVRHHIWDKLRSLKKNGVTILLTTHYMEEAFQICDDLIIMNKGAKVLQGCPGDLIKNNIETYVLEILYTDNRLKNLPYGIRTETAHNRQLLYADDFDQIKKISNRFKAGDFILRQSNLEDVFLRITGSKLNE